MGEFTQKFFGIKSFLKYQLSLSRRLMYVPRSFFLLYRKSYNSLHSRSVSNELLTITKMDKLVLNFAVFLVALLV